MDINKYYIGKLCKKNKHEYNSTGGSLRIKCNGSCYECSKLFNAKWHQIHKYEKKYKRIKIICDSCNKLFMKRTSEYKRSKHHFCCHLCSRLYIRKHYPNRSMLEHYIEKTFKKEYPSLEIIFNDRKLLNGIELDIYFPTLKFAVELNGIVHYEPIYGIDRLNQARRSDQQKTIQCDHLDIDLLIINTITKGKRRYFNIIKKVLDSKLS